MAVVNGTPSDRHNPNASTRTYVCEDCNQRFTRKQGLCETRTEPGYSGQKYEIFRCWSCRKEAREDQYGKYRNRYGNDGYGHRRW